MSYKPLSFLQMKLPIEESSQSSACQRPVVMLMRTQYVRPGVGVLGSPSSQFRYATGEPSSALTTPDLNRYLQYERHEVWSVLRNQLNPWMHSESLDTLVYPIHSLRRGSSVGGRGTAIV